MKRLMLCFLIVALLLPLVGCQKKPLVVNETEPTATYDWMAGDSPVPNHRMGIVRHGVNLEDHAVSPTGIYFIPDVFTEEEGSRQRSDDTFILYVDNGGHCLNKLCGRNDCTHDNADCNAYLYKGSDLSYYHGKLYAVTGEGPWTRECKLVRMEPDGSGHVEMFDLLAFAKEEDGVFLLCRIISDGYCVFDLYGWEEQEDGTNREDWIGSYKFKLDGSMKEPELIEESPDILYQCGESLVTLTYKTINGIEYTNCSKIDIETEQQIYLTEHPGVPAWFGDQEAYYFMDGAIRRLIYATKEETVMVDTGLEGEYFCFSFPDCLVLASQDDEEKADRNLYFYNWAFELVDTVRLDYTISNRTQFALIAETVDRVILTNKFNGQPLYYINKSELGTGNVKLHAFQYSD